MPTKKEVLAMQMQKFETDAYKERGVSNADAGVCRLSHTKEEVCKRGFQCKTQEELCKFRFTCQKHICL